MLTSQIFRDTTIFKDATFFHRCKTFHWALRDAYIQHFSEILSFKDATFLGMHTFYWALGDAYIQHFSEILPFQRCNLLGDVYILLSFSGCLHPTVFRETVISKMQPFFIDTKYFTELQEMLTSNILQRYYHFEDATFFEDAYILLSLRRCLHPRVSEILLFSKMQPIFIDAKHFTEF